ncbi:MAG: peptidoglycan DD-metalloendopeptidase family protein [Chloroflexota bacterium]
MSKFASFLKDHRFNIVSWLVTAALVASMLGGAFWWQNYQSNGMTAPVPTANPADAPVVSLPLPPVSGIVPAVARRIQLITNIPADLPRYEAVKYTVQRGDAMSLIAQKFGVTTESILYNNKDVLNDDPHALKPGMILVIPPVDGIYYTWQAGDTLEAVAAKFKAQAEDIIEFPGNEIDLVNPDDIAPGTVLMIPGGSRELIDWSALLANEGGGGSGGGSSCGGGAVGSGAFMWPTYGSHTISGNNYSAGHLGIDITANEGDAVLAADSGVVEFAGWSQYGYGNMVRINHGNGYVTLYAHLTSYFFNVCDSVTKGMQIATAGNTGNSFGAHLHFEIHLGGTPVNPRDYVQ